MSVCVWVIVCMCVYICFVQVALASWSLAVQSLQHPFNECVYG